MKPSSGIAAVGVGAVAIICCAGPTVVAGAVGGLTLAGVLGLSAGVVGFAALVVVAVLVRRRRRRCAPPPAEVSPR